MSPFSRKKVYGREDRVITAEQAQAYKPSRAIFESAYRVLGVSVEDVVHICASPLLDLTAAHNIGFRCIWINRGTGRAPLPDYTPDEECPTLAGRQHVLEEATHTLFGGQCPVCPYVARALLGTEGDVPVLELFRAVVR